MFVEREGDITMVTRGQVNTYDSKVDELGLDGLTEDGNGIGSAPGDSRNKTSRVGINPPQIWAGTNPRSDNDQEVVKVFEIL